MAVDLVTGLIGGGLGLIGSNTASNAAKDAAAAQLEAAKIAADAAAFKPYGVTTGFGTGYFDTENQLAGYTIDPALAAYRDQLMTMGAEALPSTLAQTPQAAGLQYFQDLQGYGGLPSTIAKQYGDLGAQAAGNIPTNLANTFAGLAPSSYSNLASQQANLFSGAGTSALNAPVANVANAYAGMSPVQYSNMADTMANQYAAAGSQALGQATPTAGSLYEQIRAMQRPEEERAQSALDRSLFGSGRAGMRTAEFGGTPEQMAQSKAVAEARNAAAYQAINQADQLASSQQARAQQLSSMGLNANQVANALKSEQFGQQYQLAGAGIQAAQAQQGLQQNQQNMALALANQGLSADQIANQLAAQRFGQQYQIAQGGLTAGQAQAGLSQQLSNLGMSADQVRLAQAAQARAAGMSELDAAIARGTGLMTSAFGAEQLGMTPLQMGSTYGGQAANTAGAQALLSGATGAAQANLAAGLNTSNMMQSLGLGLMKYNQ